MNYLTGKISNFRFKHEAQKYLNIYNSGTLRKYIDEDKTYNYIYMIQFNDPTFKYIRDPLLNCSIKPYVSVHVTTGEVSVYKNIQLLSASITTNNSTTLLLLRGRLTYKGVKLYKYEDFVKVHPEAKWKDIYYNMMDISSKPILPNYRQDVYKENKLWLVRYGTKYMKIVRGVDEVEAKRLSVDVTSGWGNYDLITCEPLLTTGKSGTLYPID